jgi:hypothetical protein
VTALRDWWTKAGTQTCKEADVMLTLPRKDDAYSPLYCLAALGPGGFVFTFGLGAIIGPLDMGFAMNVLGPFAFWVVLGGSFATIVLYAFYRMSQRDAVPASADRRWRVQVGNRPHGLNSTGKGMSRRKTDLCGNADHV